jgi:hypothetical protein
MKKVKFINVTAAALLSVGLLAGCGAEESTTSTKDSGSSKSKTEQTKEADAKSEAKIEVQSETYGAWTDSIGSVWVHYSAEIKNSGKASAEMGDIQINFEGADGSVLGTESMLTPTPDVVPAGETAYITATALIEGHKAEEFKKASLNMDFSSVSEKPQVLTAEAVKLTDLSGDEFANSPYKVTGTVVNTSGKKADDIRVAAGLYDASGKFIGALDGSLDVSLNADGKAGFELEFPELPKEIAGKAKEVKVKTYNWGF